MAFKTLQETFAEKVAELEKTLTSLTEAVALAKVTDRLDAGEKELALLRFQFSELCKTMALAFTSPEGVNLYSQLRALESRLAALETHPTVENPLGLDDKVSGTFADDLNEKYGESK